MARITALLLLTLLLTACDDDRASPEGFRLPDGDAAAGKAAFAKFQCAACHVVDGMPELNVGTDAQMSIRLGGMKAQTATYGRLVTSIINPNHSIAQPRGVDATTPDGQSKMQNFNDVLTVAELIDLVAFLQPQYSELPDF